MRPRFEVSRALGKVRVGPFTVTAERGETGQEAAYRRGWKRGVFEVLKHVQYKMQEIREESIRRVEAYREESVAYEQALDDVRCKFCGGEKWKDHGAKDAEDPGKCDRQPEDASLVRHYEPKVTPERTSFPSRPPPPSPLAYDLNLDEVRGMVERLMTGPIPPDHGADPFGPEAPTRK